MQVVHNTEQTGACGAVGSALPWHGRGREFESHQVHHNFSNTYIRSLPRKPRFGVQLESKMDATPQRGSFLFVSVRTGAILIPGFSRALSSYKNPTNPTIASQVIDCA